MRSIAIFLIIVIQLNEVFGQMIERPKAQNQFSSSTANIMDFPKNMMVDIMEKQSDPSIKNNKKTLGTNSCGNIGITPDRLLTFQKTGEFIVTYNGFTPESEAAFQHAVDIWSRIITTTVPIKINAEFTALGPGILGSAGPPVVGANISGLPQTNIWYPPALFDQFVGRDVSGNDIDAQFSSVFTNWYYGLDGCPGPSEFDFVTVVLHEIGHGLGFFGTLESYYYLGDLYGCYGFSNGDGNWPYVYDQFIEDGSGNKIVDFDPDYCWITLYDMLTSNDLYFNGPALNDCNTSPARIYAPSSYRSGSSYSHFDETTFPDVSSNSLMTPFVAPGEAVHDPGCSIGLLTDLGYTAHNFIPLPPSSAAIPTIGEWGIIVLSLSVLIISIAGLEKYRPVNVTKDN